MDGLEKDKHSSNPVVLLQGKRLPKVWPSVSKILGLVWLEAGWNELHLYGINQGPLQNHACLLKSKTRLPNGEGIKLKLMTHLVIIWE